MNIYTNSLSAAKKLLPEAFIGLSMATESRFDGDQYVSFTPDTNANSFNVLSGPISAGFVVENYKTALAILPDTEASIDQCVLTALNAISKDIADTAYSTSSPDKKPKK